MFINPIKIQRREFMKKGMIIVIIIIVAAGVVFFSLFWPIDKTADLKGTIGGVEKAEKYRGEQMDESDLLTENEDFVALTQSAEWQNAMKNEKVVKFLQSEEFAKFVTISSDRKVFAIYNQYFQNFYSILQNQSDLTPEKAYLILQSDNYQKVIFSQDVQHDVQLTEQDFQKWIVIWNIDTIKTVLFSADMNLADYETALQGFYVNPKLVAFFSQDFQKIFSQDFQKGGFIYSQDYLKGGFFLSQDIQSIIAYMSQDMQKIFMSQDFQKVFMSQDFQKIFKSQDFQKLFKSLDFQKYLKWWIT